MEIIKIKEQSINAEESKLYKKVLDSLGVIYETEKIKTKLPRNRQSGLKENEKIQQITLRFNCSRKIHGEE